MVERVLGINYTIQGAELESTGNWTPGRTWTAPLIMEREGYGFSKEDKQTLRDTADGRCDFGCGENNYTVHHITGCYIGKLDGIPSELIRDANLNASLLCDDMAEMHDKEEAYQVACLEYEKKGITIYEGRTYTDGRHSKRTKRNAHIQRSRQVLSQGSGRSRKSQLHWKRTTQSRRANALGKRKKHR